MDDENSGWFLKIIVVGVIFAALGVWFTLPMIRSEESASNQELHAMAAAKNIWAVWVESQERQEPSKRDAHNYVGALAQDAKTYGLVMNVKDWVFPFDNQALEKFLGVENYPEKILANVQSMNRTVYLDPNFKRAPLSWVFVKHFPSGMNRNTPIMWTRGLSEDGTWVDGVFEKAGGIIVFADGRIRWFDSLLNEDSVGVLKKFGTNDPTCNIYEAIYGGKKNIAK